MNIEEIRQALEAKKAEARKLNEDITKVEDAKKALEEARQLKVQLENAEKMEAEERAQAKEKVKEKRKDDAKMDKNVEYRALVKKLMGDELTEEERAAITNGNYNSNTGAIIPSGFIARVEAFRKGYKSLKSYCDVIPVTLPSGKMPMAKFTDILADLSEDTAMAESMINTSDMEWDVSDYGLLKKVGNDLLKDSPINFIDNLLAPNFAVASVNKENKEIATAVSGHVTAVTLGTSDVVADVIANKISAYVPSLRAGLIILTNAEGYAYFDNLKDGEGRKDDRVSYANGNLYFKGHEVVAIDSDLLPALSTDMTKVFYIINMKAIKFFDRQGMEIAKSTEAGFVYNKTLVKAIERFDVKANSFDETKGFKIEA